MAAKIFSVSATLYVTCHIAIDDFIDYAYHVPIPCHYLGLTIVHLEMVNILVALKIFGPFWATKKCWSSLTTRL